MLRMSWACPGPPPGVSRDGRRISGTSFLLTGRSVPMSSSVIVWLLANAGVLALVLARVLGLLDGPMALVRALVESYRVLPAGGIVLSEATARQAFGRVGEALELALRAAAPTALALALAGVALGLLGRAAPSLPLVALSLPVRFALGLVLVVLGLATLAATLAAAWGDWPGVG
jgi:flagellar biosynthesis protein FliR